MAASSKNERILAFLEIAHLFFQSEVSTVRSLGILANAESFPDWIYALIKHKSIHSWLKEALAGLFLLARVHRAIIPHTKFVHQNSRIGLTRPRSCPNLSCVGHSKINLIDLYPAKRLRMHSLGRKMSYSMDRRIHWGDQHIIRACLTL
jgi:hypothetical protein